MARRYKEAFLLLLQQSSQLGKQLWWLILYIYPIKCDLGWWANWSHHIKPTLDLVSSWVAIARVVVGQRHVSGYQLAKTLFTLPRAWLQCNLFIAPMYSVWAEVHHPLQLQTSPLEWPARFFIWFLFLWRGFFFFTTFHLGDFVRKCVLMCVHMKYTLCVMCTFVLCVWTDKNFLQFSFLTCGFYTVSPQFPLTQFI